MVAHPAGSPGRPTNPFWFDSSGLDLMRFMSVNLRPSLCLSILALLVLAVFAVLENLISPYDPLGIEFLPLDPPSLKNLFGTDNLGRDVFSRFVAGARISFVVGLTSVFFSSLLGILAGLTAAYFKKSRPSSCASWTRSGPSPMLLLAMALAVSLQPGMATVIIAIALVYSPLFARLVYAQALSDPGAGVHSRRPGLRLRPARLLMTHVLPNLAAPVIVQATLTVGTAIVLESSLSFLGVGIQPPTPSWGVMIQTRLQVAGGRALDVGAPRPGNLRYRGFLQRPGRLAEADPRPQAANPKGLIESFHPPPASADSHHLVRRDPDLLHPLHGAPGRPFPGCRRRRRGPAKR